MLTGARRRVLLVRLLVSANQAVRAGQLIEDIWDGAPPAGAASTLPSHVSFLRGVLGKDRLEHRDGGYVLAVADGELDTQLFETEIAEAHAARAAGDPEAAAAVFARALGRWHGGALADAAGMGWVAGETARLEELRAGTTEAWLAVRLEPGDHTSVVSDAESAVSDHPLQEGLWAALMLALYRCGRQSDALRAYRRLSTVLGEELGIEPSTQLRDLEDAILLQKPDLDCHDLRSDLRAGGRFSAIENVTILFTDVVGSTELSRRLSPEVADEVRRGHFSILRQALAQAGGTEVKNLGDGLMVVFDSASAALACGVAMQQGVERDNRGREHPVGLRVGLSGGEVTREDGDFFGDPVIEAARLCGSCESGQVLAANVVRLMAGRRSAHEYRSLGNLTLHGLPDPIEAVEVVWEPLGDADTGISIPLPGRLAVRPAMGVVGRQTELAKMTDAAKRVAEGDGREVLLISGEAGQGKTTVMAEAASAAFDSGACVLFGHCEEDLANPYQLFAEALGHCVTHATEDQLLAHVEAHGSELSRLVPALASRIPDLPQSKATDTDTKRYLLFAAVVGLLTAMSKRQPVLLVLDDLQWADKASLLLLHHLTAAEQIKRVLVLGTYRDGELSRSHPLTDTLAALRRQGGVSRIELTGLDDGEVVSFLESAAGHTLDDAGVSLAHAVYRETDGNPFFVNEVLRHLSETGAIYQDAAGRWTSEDSLEQMALPDSLREVIGARVGRLGADAGRVLSVASVIGRDFDLDLLARAAGRTDDELLDILEAAAAVALVREPADTSGRYSFVHALIQHTLYEDLGPNRRALAHRQLAEALEDLCGDRTEPAWASWPATGLPPPGPSTWPRQSGTPDRQPTPRWVPSHRRTPCSTTPRRSTSIRSSAIPIQRLGST